MCIRDRTKEALPIIRYRTRDLTRLRAGGVRTMRRMDKVPGRSDDLIILRGVNVFPSQIEEQYCKDRRYQPTLPDRARQGRAAGYHDGPCRSRVRP